MYISRLSICLFIYLVLCIGTCTPPVNETLNEKTKNLIAQDTLMGPTTPISIDSIRFRGAINSRITNSNVVHFLNCMEDSMNAQLYETIDRFTADDSIGFTIHPKNITESLKKTKGVRDGAYYVSIRFTVKTIESQIYCNVCYGIVFGPSLSVEWMYDKIGNEIWDKMNQMIQNEIRPLIIRCGN